MPKVNRSGQAYVLSPNDISLIRKQLRNDRDKLIFDVFQYTGERIGAIAQLQIADCYERRGVPRKIIVFRAATRKANPDGKRKTRQVDMHEKLIEALKAFEAPTGTKWLFPSPRDPATHITTQSIDEMLRAAVDRAGLGGVGISSHSFRRTLMTRLAALGVSARTIQEITGHASLEQVQRYVDVNPEELRKVINLL